MPTEQFKDIRLEEDFGMQIRDTEYEWSKGKIVSVPLNVASNMLNLWDVECSSASNPYEVLEREAKEKIGVKESSNSSEEEKEELTVEQVEEEDDYRTLQSYASRFDEVDASQSKEDLRDDLLEQL